MYERKGHNGFKLKNGKGNTGGSKFCVSVALIPLLPLNRRDEDCRERGEIFQPGGNFFSGQKKNTRQSISSLGGDKNDRGKYMKAAGNNLIHLSTFILMWCGSWRKQD